MRAAVIGSGSFGTALANTLATRCTEVRCWAREPAVVEAINGRAGEHHLPAGHPDLARG